MQKVQVLNYPYYDNVQLHAVGAQIMVQDNFNYGKMGNFGRVNPDGSLDIPKMKPTAEQVEAQKVSYDWVRIGPDAIEKETPIFPEKGAIPSADSGSKPVALDLKDSIDPLAKVDPAPTGSTSQPNPAAAKK